MSKILQIITLVFLLTSCEKIFIPDMQSDNRSIFQDVYQVANENYVFFEYKGINWDSIYFEYQPRITNTMSNEDFFLTLSSFVNELKDAHTQIIWNNKSITYDFTNGANHNFNKDLIINNYLENDYLSAGKIIYKKINYIGYIYIPNFWHGNENEQFDDILSFFQDTKGIIIDIRDNGGGNNMSGREIARHFITEKILVEKWKSKNGPGHNDFTKTIDVFIEPTDGIKYLKNIVLLTNRKVYSAANDFTNVMNQLPKVKLIGDTTGGGGGVPREYILSNGWIFRFTDTFTLDPQEKNIENGIAPDIFIEMDTIQIEIDEILERAIVYLN